MRKVGELSSGGVQVSGRIRKLGEDSPEDGSTRLSDDGGAAFNYTAEVRKTDGLQSMLESCDRGGVMFKQGQKRKNWKPRLFLLRGNELEYLEMRKKNDGFDATPKGKVTVTGIYDVPGRLDKREHRIDVRCAASSGRLLSLSCDAPADKRDWMAALLAVPTIEQLQPSTHPRYNEFSVPHPSPSGAQPGGGSPSNAKAPRESKITLVQGASSSATLGASSAPAPGSAQSSDARSGGCCVVS